MSCHLASKSADEEKHQLNSLYISRKHVRAVTIEPEISSNSIAKLGKNEPVRMDVLMKTAKALDCKVEDLFETINDEDSENA
jgi:DNA-binding Xre family transcriptional regulator